MTQTERASRRTRPNSKDATPIRQIAAVGAALMVGLTAYLPLSAERSRSSEPPPVPASIAAPNDTVAVTPVVVAGSATPVSDSVLRLLEASGTATQMSQAELEGSGLPSSVARLLIEREVALAIPEIGGAG